MTETTPPGIVPKDERARQSALEMLKHGMSREKLTLQLAEKEKLDIPQAKRIADSVWQEHKATRRTNIIILSVVAGILILIGVAIAVSAGNLPLAVVPGGFGVLLAWSAFGQIRGLSL